MDTVLKIEGISKNYGSLIALDNVSLEIPKGSIFGILGPNGSGKTTMLGIVLDALHADTGIVSWFGEKLSSGSRKRIGALLETPNYYQYLSAIDNLTITQAISGRGSNNNLNDIESVLQTVNLSQRKNNKFSTYSLGMKQRLAIAGALLGHPDVLVLDEPTNGLDPVGIIEIRRLIKELAKEGKTIIIASHLLDEVEKVCTHVAIMKKGKLLASGSVEAVLQNDEIIEVASENMELLKSILPNYPNLKTIKEELNQLELYFSEGTAELTKLNQFCFSNGVVLNHLHFKKKSLEAKFLELTNN